MKCSLTPRFHIVDVTLKSTPRSHLLKTYIQNILWAPLSFLERECSYLAEWLPMVCCLFDLIPFIPVNIFSVKSCQNGSYWVELSLSRLLYVLPVMSVSCDLVGKGWPLGSLVCDVFLCFVTFPYRVLGHVWYLIVSPSDFCFLLYFAQWQYAGSTYETQTSNLSISTQTLYHWVLHFHCCVWWLQWKFQITAMIWSLTSRTNISCTFWREFLFHFC